MGFPSIYVILIYLHQHENMLVLFHAISYTASNDLKQMHLKTSRQIQDCEKTYITYWY